MKILLHICCGVCSCSVAQKLIEDGHEVTGYFYNPNMYPSDEYDRRLKAAREAASHIGFDLEEGEFEHSLWKDLASGLEDAPEGGFRCEVCFRMRLMGTYSRFLGGGFDKFTTTLTVSPLKDADTVNRIGEETAGDFFMQANFKKQDGFKKTIRTAGEIGLYKQDYCGCEWSMKSGGGEARRAAEGKDG